VHHGSEDKPSIYAGLGVPEVWRYDGEKLTIKLLEGGNYVEAEQSRALPVLTADLLTGSLRRLRDVLAPEPLGYWSRLRLAAWGLAPGDDYRVYQDLSPPKVDVIEADRAYFARQIAPGDLKLEDI
jgi:hypothetical protein